MVIAFIFNGRERDNLYKVIRFKFHIQERLRFHSSSFKAAVELFWVLQNQLLAQSSFRPQLLQDYSESFQEFNAKGPWGPKNGDCHLVIASILANGDVLSIGNHVLPDGTQVGGTVVISEGDIVQPAVSAGRPHSLWENKRT